MLAALTLFAMRDINAMNGLKMALVGVMTFTSIASVASRIVRWPEALADYGELGGRRLCRRVSPAQPSTSG